MVLPLFLLDIPKDSDPYHETSDATPGGIKGNAVVYAKRPRICAVNAAVSLGPIRRERPFAGLRTKKSSNSTRLLNNRWLLLPGFIVAALLLFACLLWSITLGAAEIDRDTVFTALLQPDETAFEHLIIQTVRLPRVLAGVLVGIALAVAGAIMQALTRNPLADSGILGINAGAAFAVVVTVFLLRVSSLGAYALAGMVGAAAAGVLVYG